MNKVVRIVKKTFLWVAILLVTILLLVLAVVQLPSVRKFVLHKVVNSLTEKTKSVITIDDLHISFSGLITLDKIYAEDLSNDTLLYANHQ